MMLEEKIAMAQTIRGGTALARSARKSWPPCRHGDRAAHPRRGRAYRPCLRGATDHLPEKAASGPQFPRRRLHQGAHRPGPPLLLHHHGAAECSGLGRGLLHCSGRTVPRSRGRRPTASPPMPLTTQKSWASTRTRSFWPGTARAETLVAAACLKNAESHRFSPCCVLMEYFPVDNAASPVERLSPQLRADPFWVKRAETEKLYTDFYVGDADPAQPLCSPLNAADEALASFPDSLILSAGEDSLREDVEAFVLRLVKAGVASQPSASRRLCTALPPTGPPVGSGPWHCIANSSGSTYNEN